VLKKDKRCARRGILINHAKVSGDAPSSPRKSIGGWKAKSRKAVGTLKLNHAKVSGVGEERG